MAKALKTYSSDKAIQSLGQGLSEALARWLATTQPTDLWQTCVTCQHMSKTGPALCKKFSAVPPATVIAGVRICEAYIDDETIPF